MVNSICNHLKLSFSKCFAQRTSTVSLVASVIMFGATNTAIAQTPNGSQQWNAWAIVPNTSIISDGSTVTTYDSISPVVYQGYLYLFIRNSHYSGTTNYSGGNVGYIATDGLSWGPYVSVPSSGGLYGAAPVVYNNTLYLIETLGTKRIAYRYFNGSTWSDRFLIGNINSDREPSVIVSNGGINAYVRGDSDGKCYTSRFNGSTWSAWVQGPQDAVSTSPYRVVITGPNPLAAPPFGTELVYYKKKSDTLPEPDRPFYNPKNDSTGGWLRQATLLGMVSGAPEMFYPDYVGSAVSNGTANVFLTAVRNNTVYWNYHNPADAGTTTGWWPIPTTGNFSPPTPIQAGGNPSAIFYNGKIYAFVPGNYRYPYYAITIP